MAQLPRASCLCDLQGGAEHVSFVCVCVCACASAPLPNVAGVWSALIMAFKLCFPSGASGRRRLVKPLRRVAWRLMPKAMSRKLAELQSCASPGLNRSCESLDEGFAEEDGGDQGDPPAVQVGLKSLKCSSITHHMG